MMMMGLTQHVLCGVRTRAERTQCAQLLSRLHTTAASTSRLHHTRFYTVCSPDDGHNEARNMLSYPIANKHLYLRRLLFFLLLHLFPVLLQTTEYTSRSVCQKVMLTESGLRTFAQNNLCLELFLAFRPGRIIYSAQGYSLYDGAPALLNHCQVVWVSWLL